MLALMSTGSWCFLSCACRWMFGLMVLLVGIDVNILMTRPSGDDAVTTE